MPPDDTIPEPVTVVVTQPTGNEEAERQRSEALTQIAARLDAIEARITTEVEGVRSCQTETITSLQTQLADQQANLQALTSGLSPQVQELREQLTQLSLSLQAAVQRQPQTPEVNNPEPETPPETPPENVDATHSPAPVTNASPNATERSQKPRKRVV